MSTALAPAPTVVVEQISATLGARVHGVDLAGPLDDDTIVAIEDALVAHKVLFFRAQRLDPASHVAFARRLGDLTAAHPTVGSLPGHPNVFELDAGRGARANVWHTDVTFLHRPPRASILHAVEIPPVGGDTIWADTEAAYLEAPVHLRSLAEQAWAIHTNTTDYAQLTTAGDDYATEFHAAAFEARHPVVRVHPLSGRPSLLLGGFARRLEGMSSAESADVIRLLQAHVTRPELTVRWRWRAGDVAIWDNQSTQHYALHDYGSAPRRVQWLPRTDGLRSSRRRTCCASSNWQRVATVTKSSPGSSRHRPSRWPRASAAPTASDSPSQSDRAARDRRAWATRRSSSRTRSSASDSFEYARRVDSVTA